jgi:hypothetical protein
MRTGFIIYLLCTLISCQSPKKKVEEHQLSERIAMPIVTPDPSQKYVKPEDKPSAGVVFQIEYFGIYLAHLPDSFSITSRPSLIGIDSDGDYEINITTGSHFVATLEIRPFSNVTAMYLDQSSYDIDGARVSRTLKGKNVIYQMEAETSESPTGIVLLARVDQQFEKWFRNSLKFHAPRYYDSMIVSSYDQILPVIYPDKQNTVTVEWTTTISGGNEKLGLLFTNPVSGNTTAMDLDYVAGKIELTSTPIQIDETHEMACRFWYGGQGKTFLLRLDNDSLNVYRVIEEEMSESQKPQLFKTIPMPVRSKLSLITYKPEKVCAS